ncbi:MAG: bifunctional heptose 7-phosphate kinase/heptose 1-phosphate adenyltransferase [Pirellulales bacterium]
MTPKRLRELLDSFPSLRVAVVGDFFLDKYLDIDPQLAERSIETGKTAHQVVAISSFPGAAGTVVNNLATLGAGTLHAVGAIGDDGEGFELRRGLQRRGCETGGLAASDSLKTPTYLKPRDIDRLGLEGEHERYDTKNRDRTPDKVVRGILESLDDLLDDLDAVIIADQVEEEDCGMITAAVRNELAERAARFPNIRFWADSRNRIRLFRNVIIKPNQFEAVGHENPQPDDTVDPDQVRQATAELRRQTGAPVCVTRGVEGMLVTDPEWTTVPGVRLEGPIDPTGAGDSVTASAVLALAAGASFAEAALVGILTSSITVQQIGMTGTATPQQVVDRLTLWHEQNG